MTTPYKIPPNQNLLTPRPRPHTPHSTPTQNNIHQTNGAQSIDNPQLTGSTQSIDNAQLTGSTQHNATATLPQVRAYSIGTAHSIGLIGIQGWLLTIQCSISPGLPQFSIIGLPDTVLQESRERIRATFSLCRLPWSQSRITVNLSPASVPKTGSSHDIAIALSICAATNIINEQALIGVLAIGELSLDGHIMPITGLLPMALHAANQGIHTLIVAQANIQEAQLVHGLTVIGVEHFTEIIERYGKPQYRRRATAIFQSLHTTQCIQHAQPDRAQFDCSQTNHTQPEHHDMQHTQSHHNPGDMSQVIGQVQAKYALMVAAAGGHHIMMIGPPGTGKTMLASRFVTILPPLTPNEQLEVASIRSLVGTIDQYGITDTPPFEAPHHSATAAALVGGGHSQLTPGAITRAHRGVLFLDEAPEFQPRVLQTIREPLETGSITIVRARQQATYPAQVQLILAANPCPCGYSWGSGRNCTCSSKEKMRYLHRLSGPIVDRIDIQIEVPLETQWHTSLSTHDHTSYSSASMQATVIEARERAAMRFREYGWTCNAMASSQWLREHTPTRVLQPILHALEREQLSLRGADRTLKLAWTLADLEAKSVPTIEHIASGLTMRTRDHT